MILHLSLSLLSGIYSHVHQLVSLSKKKRNQRSQKLAENISRKILLCKFEETFIDYQIGKMGYVIKTNLESCSVFPI